MDSEKKGIPKPRIPKQWIPQKWIPKKMDSEKRIPKEWVPKVDSETRDTEEMGSEAKQTKPKHLMFPNVVFRFQPGK